MAVNAAGFVCPQDGAVPRTFTGVAFETISAGELCYVSGAADAVSSGTNSLVYTDTGIVNGASGGLFNGVAVQSASSGAACTIQMKGNVIVRAGGNITAGKTLAANGAEDVVESTTAGQIMGRSLSEATSGNYVLVQLL